MKSLILLVKMIMVLVAAISLGDWFLSKVKQARAEGKPVYVAYFSLPGILILTALLLPIVLWLRGSF
ncbi:MAG: hypothetical protein B5M56_00255 [Desulfococcus sp. 4484_241]|nr:MAG: hypothetical protein B5M56_00255 [Desulfococcus sp. 4484_241]